MTPQNVEVVTRNIANPDEPAKRMVINMNHSHHRSWFNRHLDWAVRSAWSVSIYPTDSDVTFVDKPVRVGYEDRTRGTKRLSAAR